MRITLFVLFLTLWTSSAISQQSKVVTDQKFIKEYPFYASVTCIDGNSKFRTGLCFKDNNLKTELELRNGTFYKMYTFDDLFTMEEDDNDGIVFNLRPNFEIKMQNSRKRMLLNLKIYSRANGKIVFEKSASQFGTIMVSN
jgi:hypothetical protein